MASHEREEFFPRARDCAQRGDFVAWARNRPAPHRL